MLRSIGGIVFESKLARSGVVASADAELALGSLRCISVACGFGVALSVLGLVLTFSFDSLLSSGRGNGLAFDLISVRMDQCYHENNANEIGKIAEEREKKEMSVLPLVAFDLDAVVLGLAPLFRRSDDSFTGDPASRSFLMPIDGMLSNRFDAVAFELFSSLILSNTSVFNRSVPLIDVEVTDFVIWVVGRGDELLLTDTVAAASFVTAICLLVEDDALNDGGQSKSNINQYILIEAIVI